MSSRNLFGQVAGLSFGGAVAFEVCQKLVQHGKTATAIMLDTVCPKKGHFEMPDETNVPQKHVMGKLDNDEINSQYWAELRNNERILNAYSPDHPVSQRFRVVLLKARGIDSTSQMLRGLEDPLNGWGWLKPLPEIYSTDGSHFTMCEPVYALRTAALMQFVLRSECRRLSSLSDLWLHAVRHGDTFIYSKLMQHDKHDKHDKHDRIQEGMLLEDDLAAEKRIQEWMLLEDDQGLTALHLAAENDDAFLLCKLQAKGADFSRKSSKGLSAFDSAMQAESFQSCSFLMGAHYDHSFNTNKRQLEMFTLLPEGFEKRGGTWLRTLRSINESGQVGRAMPSDADAPMAQQMNIFLPEEDRPSAS